MAGRALLLGLALAALASPAPAQETADPLVVTVRAYRVEAGEGSLARQERLLRRAQQRDFAFRSICRGCAALAATAPPATFRPLDTLAVRPKAAPE